MTRPTLALLFSSILAPGLAFCLTQAPAHPDPAGATSPDTPANPAVSAPDESPEQKRRDALVASLQPENGEWLTDAEGRAYFIRKHPKSIAYQKLSETRVRIVYGGEFELAGEDDEDLWLKVYRLDPKVSLRTPTIVAPTPAELAAAAATFQNSTPSVDRLKLKPFDDGLPTRGLWRNGFDLADMNGDGELDFVQGPPRRSGDQPRVFTGDGHGTWRPFKVNVPPDLLDYGDAKVADFNRDGKPDMAFASHLRGITVFVGDGSGNFSFWGEGLDFDKPGQGSGAAGFSSRRLEVVDWNKDGWPDLLALSEGPRIAVVTAGKESKVTDVNLKPEVFGPRIFLNQKNGTWRVLEQSEAQQEIFGDDLAVADFDGDGRPDFLTSANDMGREDLLYVQGKVVGGPWKSVELPVRQRSYVNAVAAGDFNGDRRPDIALAYTSFELGVTRVGIDLYLAHRDGKWERRPIFSREDRIPISALEAGDLDGDKALDLVTTDHDGFFELFLGDGKGGFARESSPEAQQPRGRCRGYGLRMADLDHDGRAEIVASYAGESNVLYDPDRCPGGGGVTAWTLDPGK